MHSKHLLPWPMGVPVSEATANPTPVPCQPTTRKRTIFICKMNYTNLMMTTKQKSRGEIQNIKKRKVRKIQETSKVKWQIETQGERKNRDIHRTKQIQRISGWLPDERGFVWMGKKGEGIKKFKLVVTEQS